MQKLDKATANKMVALLERMNDILYDITQEDDRDTRALLWIKYGEIDALYHDVLSALGSLDTFCEAL